MSRSAVGTIFNVQRFSLHDGPGMRDLIFLKAARSGASGAPIRSHSMRSELSCRPSKCIGCGPARACPTGPPPWRRRPDSGGPRRLPELLCLCPGLLLRRAEPDR